LAVVIVIRRIAVSITVAVIICHRLTGKKKRCRENQEREEKQFFHMPKSPNFKISLSSLCGNGKCLIPNVRFDERYLVHVWIFLLIVGTGG